MRRHLRVRAIEEEGKNQNASSGTNPRNQTRRVVSMGRHNTSSKFLLAGVLRAQVVASVDANGTLPCLVLIEYGRTDPIPNARSKLPKIRIPLPSTTRQAITKAHAARYRGWVDPVFRHCLHFFHSSNGMRGIWKRSEVRAYQPEPCMRPISLSLGVSM